MATRAQAQIVSNAVIDRRWIDRRLSVTVDASAFDDHGDTMIDGNRGIGLTSSPTKLTPNLGEIFGDVRSVPMTLGIETSRFTNLDRHKGASW